MIRIAICDEDASFLDRLEGSIVRYMSQCSESVIVYKFNNPVAFESAAFESAKKIKPDCLIMNCAFAEDKGFEIAKNVKEHEPRCELIFMSDKPDCLEKIFGLKPFWAYIKPVKDDVLEASLNELINIHYSNLNKKMLIANNTRLRCDDIVFIESDRRKVRIRTGTSVEEIYSKLDEIEKKVGPGFVRCHQSYMVNLDKIRSVKGHVIYMQNGVQVPISRSRYGETIRKIEG